MSTTIGRTRSGSDSSLAGRGPMLLAMVLAVLGYQINATMLSPALPDVIERLGTTTAAAGLSQTLFFLMAAIGQVTLARLSDQRGRKPMMIVCAIVLIIGNLLCVFAPNIEIFIAGRVLQGISAAMFTLAFLTLNQLLTPAGFGKAAGIITAVNGGLAGVDAIAGGQIADTIGFRGIFVCSTLIAVAGLLGVRKYVPDVPPTTADARFDSRGIAALALGLTGVLVGLAQGGAWGWTSPLTLGFLLGGVASLVYFVVSQKSAENPVIDIEVLASRRAWPLLITTICTLGGAFGAIALTIPLFSQDARVGLGLSAVTAAVLFLTPIQLIGVISAPLTGRLGPKIGWRTIVVTGAVANFAIFLFATFFLHNEWILVAALAALGVTYGGFMLTGLNGLAVTTAPKDKPGSLSGLNGACFGIGASLGIALASAMITAGSDAQGVTEAGYQHAMYTALALLGIGVVTAFLIQRPDPADTAEADEPQLVLSHH
ncbi:MFS transporter [Streptomyces purpureus]|uniref:MFS transporter n=1 Tax=Streptomyces purpureus TaxID=1951 RepID=A0A918LUV6_9ACTN|nr:MFS transporter [Streptomyces purpureus]GGT56893.1 MFS transporter [Streptomyces purpureus]